MPRKFKHDEIEQIKVIAREIVDEILNKLNERKQAVKKQAKKEQK